MQQDGQAARQIRDRNKQRNKNIGPFKQKKPNRLLEF